MSLQTHLAELERKHRQLEEAIAQHEAIHAAIMAGDGNAARNAAQAHMDYIAVAIREAARSGEWQRISQLRLQKRRLPPQA